MKKLIVLAIAMLFVLPAFVNADPKVTLSGQYWVEGYDAQNAGNDYDDATSADEEAYFWSRLRVGTTIKANDNTSFHFRMDLDENSYWGDDDYSPSRAANSHSSTAPRDSTPVQLDKAYVDVMNGMWSLRVGMQPAVFGNLINETLMRGFKLAIKTPVAIDLYWGKVDEGGSAADNITANDDHDYYAASLAYGGDMGTVQLFYAVDNDGTERSDKNVFGIQGTTTLGAVDLNAEFNAFGGSNDITNVENEGKQAYIKATTKLSDVWMVGLQGLWAEGNDSALETQDTHLNDLDDFDVSDYGVSNCSYELVNAFNVGQTAATYDGDAGMLGIVFITDFQLNDKILLQGSIGYFEPEEEKATDIDSITTLSASIKYSLFDNTYFSLQGNYASPDTEDGAKDDAASAIIAGMKVTF